MGETKMANINLLPIIFLQARGFKDVFNHLNQSYIDTFIDGHPSLPNSANYMSVTATNAAFACELYLKAIFVYEHRNDDLNFAKTHNLYSLFNNIPKKRKLEIIDIFNKKYHYNRDYFLRQLKDISNDFVDFRYLFQQKEARVLNLGFFAVLLNELDIILNNILEDYDFSEDLNFIENETQIVKRQPRT